jgi:hypothetical protein
MINYIVDEQFYRLDAKVMQKLSVIYEESIRIM